jgi:hypothetical protein
MSIPLTVAVGIRGSYTECLLSCTLRAMNRINVTLDDEHAAKLAALAERTHVQEGTLARSLLFNALDDADPDPSHIVALLDGIPGAWEGAQEGREQAARGEGIALDELA